MRVLATPVMVNLMEAAALQAVDGLLPAGFQTVGTRLDIRHFAATPVGLRASARAEVVAIEGRTLTFHLAAQDEREAIGDGTQSPGAGGRRTTRCSKSALMSCAFTA